MRITTLLCIVSLFFGSLVFSCESQGDNKLLLVDATTSIDGTAVIDAGITDGATTDGAGTTDANSFDSAPPRRDGGQGPIEFACTLAEVQPIIQCVANTCTQNTDPQAIIECAITQCASTLLGLSGDCLQCALSAVSADPQTILQNCL